MELGLNSHNKNQYQYRAQILYLDEKMELLIPFSLLDL